MSAAGPAEARRLTTDDLRQIVRRVLEGEGSLDELVSAALFGSYDARPYWWRDWPQHARDAWDLAVWLHRLETDRPRGLKRSRNAPDLTAAWDTIQEFAPDPDRWWEVPGISWSAMAELLNVGPRTVHYHVTEVLGFRFEGLGRERRVAEAPCMGCGDPFPAAEIQDRRCPSCR